MVVVVWLVVLFCKVPNLDSETNRPLEKIMFSLFLFAYDKISKSNAKIHTILCIKTCFVNQVQSTSYYVTCGERRSIRFTSSRCAKRMSVIRMITVWVFFPTCLSKQSIVWGISSNWDKKTLQIRNFDVRKTIKHQYKISNLILLTLWYLYLFWFILFYEFIPGSLFVLTPWAQSPTPIYL